MLAAAKVRPEVLLEGVRYPDEDRLRHYLDAGVLTHETLAEAFFRSFQEHADRLALVGPDGEWTYRELDERATRLGAALLDMGVKPLDRALFQCGNSHELLLAFFACLRASIIPICALQAFRKLEVTYLSQLAEATVHFIQGDDPKFDDVAFAKEVRSEVSTLKYILQARGERSEGVSLLQDLIDGMPLERAKEILSTIRFDPFQVVVFQLSGGTTGVPKIIPRFQNEYLYNMRAVAACHGYSASDVLFFPTPFMHNLNMGCYFGPFLLSGAKVTVCRDIGEETLRGLVRTYRPTWFGVAGPILGRILPELQRSDDDEKARRKFVVPKNGPALERITGSRAYHIFGMTEGVIMYTRDDDPAEAKATSVGYPICAYDEVKIVRPGTEEPVADGETGEALFRGPYTIRGYYKSEKEDVHRFTSDGFYRSGDLMSSKVIDGKRYYFFAGRLKDVIDRGGEKINSEEVENVINGHPAVFASAVVGMPDPTYGEKVCAFIIPAAPGKTFTLAELCEYLKGVGLAKFKWPERIEFIQEFPLAASGKASKPILRERIAEILKAEAEKPTVAGGQ